MYLSIENSGFSEKMDSIGEESFGIDILKASVDSEYYDHSFIPIRKLPVIFGSPQNEYDEVIKIDKDDTGFYIELLKELNTKKKPFIIKALDNKPCEIYLAAGEKIPLAHATQIFLTGEAFSFKENKYFTFNIVGFEQKKKKKGVSFLHNKHKIGS